MKYLGYSAFNSPYDANYSIPSTANPRNLREFEVNGTFGAYENTALRAFRAITQLDKTTASSNLPTNSGRRDYLWGIEDVPATNGAENLAWLNAYNAPHWMNIYASFGIPTNRMGSTEGNFKDGTSASFEIYATSWERDLLRAWDLQKNTLAAAGMSTSTLELNGLSDPGYKAVRSNGTPQHNERNHSIGMGIDLGVNRWIDRRNQRTQDATGTGNNPTLDLGLIFGRYWNFENARYWAGLLPDSMSGSNNNLPKNNQQQALRDFLSLYAVTQNDTIANNGSWEELRAKIRNGDAVLPALFGDGTQSGGLIAHVLIGDSKKNPYDNIHRVLTELNISNGTSSDHQNHFHITLQAPELVKIEPNRNLLVEDVVAAQTQALPAEALRVAAQALLEEVQPEFEFEKGEIIMFAIDMPDVPPQYWPVVVVQASQVPDGDAKTARTIGVCHLIDSSPDAVTSAVNVFDPLGSVEYYLKQVEHRNVGIEGKVTLLQGPKHGTLDMGATSGGYVPNPGYLGRDSASFLVEIGGYKVKVVYSFKILDYVPQGSEGYDPYEDKKYCPKGEHWKISFNLTDPDSGAYPSDFLSQLASPIAGLSDVRVDITELARGSVGQSTSGRITLDNDAAGHGWFIDTTPNSNEEFLPTSNPNVWVARLGSAAEGKMDMLSVLMHEYGHVLGLDHSSDANDVMAALLQPGVRKLWSESDLAKLNEAIASNSPEQDPVPIDRNSDGLPVGGQTRIVVQAGRGRVRTGSGLGGDGNTSDQDAANTQALRVVNATLQNGDFETSQTWDTHGAISLDNGEVVLTEADIAMSGLTQAFVMQEGVKGIRFTIKGIEFGSNGDAPSDAFEVAVLDPLTGLPVAGVTTQSRTDALFNLQANGVLAQSNSVTSKGMPGTINGMLTTDQPITVTIDLSSVQAGKAIQLYFDLLGFGPKNSRVVIDDVKLLTTLVDNVAPVALVDAITVAEDSSVVIDVLANDHDADGNALTAVVTQGPVHGALTKNADGTFTYTPDANFNGTDSFSYRANDGALDSEPAWVTINVTPVNDAPIVANRAATLDEDASIAFDLLADVVDIDGDTLSIVPVGTPAHGRVERNAEGRYIYTPLADYAGSDSFTFDVSDGAVTVRAQMFLTVNPVNDAPVANDFAVSLAEDSTLRIDPLVHASDVDSITLTTVIVSGPAHGSVITNGDGTFTYTPTANYNGTDRFTYKISDGMLESAFATVDLIVSAVNDAPEATADIITLAEDGVARIDVSANDRDIDGDALIANIVSGPTHGTLVHNNDGTLGYMPDHNFFGSDSFTYRANDGQADSGFATVAITVTAVNDAAEAKNDSVTMAEDSAVRVDVLANDSDVEGDALIANIVTGPAHGTLVRNTDGTFTYTANRDYFGADSFTYKANDGQIDSNLATVSITVTQVNDKPEATNLVLSSPEDTGLRVDLLATARDVDSTTLTVLRSLISASDVQRYC